MKADTIITDPVTYAEDDGIVTLTLNIPEQRNAISDVEVIDALVGALTRAELASTARVVVLTGAGTVFSAGGNLKRMGKSGGLADSRPPLTRLNYQRGIQRIPAVLERLEIPVIAAINGPAIGAGCDLACMCDIRIASERASFAVSFVKLGIVPGDGGAWLLPRIVGFSKATELALTGKAFDAAEALRIGLVSEVVPHEMLLPAAIDVARVIAQNPPQAVRLTKRLLRQAWNQNLDTVLEISSAMQALAHSTSDHEEALAAMLEKRPARFEGK